MRFGVAASLGIAAIVAACGRGEEESVAPGAAPTSTTQPPSAVDGAAPPPAVTCGVALDLPEATARSGDDSLVVQCDGSAELLTLTALEDATVRVRYGKGAGGSIVPIEPLASAPLTVGRNAASDALMCFGDLRVAVTPHTCRVRMTDASGRVLIEDGEAGGFFQRTDAIGVTRSLATGERIFGLGLHTRSASSLDLRGSVVDLYNTDAYDDQAKGFRPDAPRLYESIPFYLGLRDGIAYGVFTDNTHHIRFDVGQANPNRLEVAASGGAVDQYWFAGPTLKDVLRRYTRLTGRAPLPPPWAIGMHLSRWEGPCDGAPADRPFCSASQVEAVAQRLRDEQLPADGLFLDIQHMDGFRSFTFDPTRFPQPIDLTQKLGALGLHTSVIVDPGIKIDPNYSVYVDGLAGDHFLRTASGPPFIGEVWPGSVHFPDFGATKTRAWWGDLVAGLSQKGIRGAWIDMNEPSNFTGGTAPDDLVTNTDSGKRTMAELHNAYAFFEAKATRAGFAKAAPNERPFLLSRAAFAGQQRFSAVWTGDAPSTWTTLAGTLPMLLQLGLSGMSFAGSDVGGYSGREESTADLYARWMALGSISPFFRVHAEKDARRQEPWSFGADDLAATRTLAGQRYELFPYLYSAFYEAQETGLPVLRPLVLEFQDDPLTHTTVDAAMLGANLLVAPVLEKGALSRKVYLPAGRWFELASGASLTGGGEVEISSAPEPLPSDALPMFARAGAIVPRIAKRDRIGTGARTSELFVDLFPGTTPSSFVLYEDDGAPTPTFAKRTISAEPKPGGMRIAASLREGQLASPGLPIVFRVRRADRDVSNVSLDGATLTRTTDLSALTAPGFAYDTADRSIVVAVPDAAAAFAIELTYDPTLDNDGVITVPLTVTIPADTPLTTPIHVASSATSWTHQPLTRTGNLATGTLTAPRGSFLFFKITRGDWATVETEASCSDVANRHAFMTASAKLEARVSAWADHCP